MKHATLGPYIRSLRIQNRMTQSQLAEKLNVTDKAVSKWERDLSYPDIALFPKLADTLGVNVGDLLNECIDADQRPTTSERRCTSSSDAQIWRSTIMRTRNDFFIISSACGSPVSICSNRLTVSCRSQISPGMKEPKPELPAAWD